MKKVLIRILITSATYSLIAIVFLGKPIFESLLVGIGVGVVLVTLDRIIGTKKADGAGERMQRAVAEVKAARDSGERPKKRIQIVK